MDGGCGVWRNKNNLKFFDILNKIEFTINSLNVGFFEKLLGKMEKLSFYTKISTNIFFTALWMSQFGAYSSAPSLTKRQS